MNIDDLTVDVNCNLCVDDKTARACLMMLEVYLNSHSELEIIGERLPDGYKVYRFVNLKEELKK